MPTRDSIENLEYGISKNIEKNLEKYFALHKGESVPPGLYERIINEVDHVVIKSVLKHSGGNQLKASKILGINRNTLRKKIIKLNIGEADS